VGFGSLKRRVEGGEATAVHADPETNRPTSSPAASAGMLAGRQLEVDGQRLEPDIQAILAAVERASVPPLETLSVEQARVSFRSRWQAAAGAPLPVGRIRDLNVAGATGPLPARLYGPVGSDERRPLLVYFHGGGYVVGDLETHDGVCRTFCREAGIHVLSIEYRLAPEHPFPAGVEDAQAALAWSLRNARRLRALSGSIAVGGDSAGATLATVATWLTVRAGGEAPALQVLLYPGADQAAQYRSHELFAQGFGFGVTELDWFNDLYAPGPSRSDPRISPLRASNISGMPTTIVATAGFDPLRDEAEAYAAALDASGNDTYLLRFSGLIHGFANLIGVSAASRRAVHEIAELTRSLLERSS
jgi:acetyl esterase/lipase